MLGEALEGVEEASPLIRFQGLEQVVLVGQGRRYDSVVNRAALGAQVQALGAPISVVVVPLEQTGVEQSADRSADGHLVHGGPLGHFGCGHARVAADDRDHPPFGHAQPEALLVSARDAVADAV